MSALVGTGLLTLSVALTGVAGLSDDLQAASQQAVPASTTPLLTPEDELSGPSISEEQLRSLSVDCPDADESPAASGTSKDT
ncbi:MAG: hypothetical protein JHD16_07835 [Solirubrobacteraceae bacterium]|nr:hypothetical protein [Solirubrobacteraceae bacterium]